MTANIKAVGGVGFKFCWLDCKSQREFGAATIELVGGNDVRH